jgi:ribonuclease HI
VIAYCDGAARGNPGPAGFGVHVTDQTGRTIHEIAQGIGIATNNVAEYSAVLAALEWAIAEGVGELLVRSDSHLVIEQMSGRYKVKNENLQKLHRRARGLAATLPKVSYEHVRREYNKEADALANRGVDEWLAAGGDSPAKPSLF